MRGRCERAAVSSRVSIVWGAALNRILRMRRDNIVNDNQSLPEKSGLKLRSLSASNGSRALTKVRRAAFNANEQHSPTPTPSAGAADPPHRGYRIHTSCSSFMALTPRFAAWNWNQPLSITMGPGLP